jgi:DNA-binding LytR/AlgR family response regulator
MPKINGFNIAGEINRRSDDTLIIFVTNYDNYVYTSIKYRPFRFIRKSKIAVEIKEALRSALNEIIYKNKYLELGVKYFNEKIFLSDVIYIESKRNYAELNATNGEKYKYRSALSKLEDELKSYDFVRIHAGYLVNMRHIHLIKDDVITLSNGEQLNISRRLHKSVLEQYREYMRR